MVRRTAGELIPRDQLVFVRVDVEEDVAALFGIPMHYARHRAEELKQPEIRHAKQSLAGA